MVVIFGIALPIGAWLYLGWPLLFAAMSVLLLRRPPVLLLLYPLLRRQLKGMDIAYIGWFGPIGVAAIYYASLARSQMHDPLVWYAASAMIFASIMVHGATAAPFTRLHERSE